MPVSMGIPRQHHLLYEFNPSYLTHEQWVVIAPDLPRAKPGVHPHRANLGTIFDAIFNDASAAFMMLVVLSGASLAENFLINNLKKRFYLFLAVRPW